MLMDKELNSIADDIIKDSFGSAAPAAPPAPETSKEAPTETSAETPKEVPPTPPATPAETFTAEIPQPVAPPRPVSNSRPAVSSMPVMGQASAKANDSAKTNEYARIKEQMSAARENSNLPPSQPFTGQPIINQSKKGPSRAIILLIILIPLLVVAAGLVIALLNQPTDNGNNSSNTNNNTTYKDPRDTATKINLSTYTEEINIDKAGHYILSGTTNFPIKVNADGEVTLYLHNISVTATGASALSNFSHNHLVIYLDDGTESTLAVTEPDTFDSIYSEGDLTIDGGTGILNVSGIKLADGAHYDVTGNGIKDSKNNTAGSGNASTESSATEAIAPAGQAEGEAANIDEGTTPDTSTSENVSPASAGPALN